MTSKKIRELHELLTDGIITPDDFDEAKDALLNDLSQDNSESTISIRELHALLTDGIVTKDDFDKAKQYLLKSEDSNPSFNQNLFLTWLHLSGLLAFLFPCLGCMVPVVLWQTHRHYPEVDKHGRMITDWIINLIGLSLVSMLFTLIMAGDPEDIIFVFSLITAPVQATVAIVGAIKAWQGELFQYPLIWKFFSRVPGEEQPLFRFVKTVRGAKSRFKKIGCLVCLVLLTAASTVEAVFFSRTFGQVFWSLVLLCLTGILGNRWFKWFTRPINTSDRISIEEEPSDGEMTGNASGNELPQDSIVDQFNDV